MSCCPCETIEGHRHPAASFTRSATFGDVTTSDSDLRAATTVSATTPDGPAELSGSLDGFTTAEVFELLVATRSTGVLNFSDPVGATLWITDGRISYGTSPGTPGPRELLDRQGIVSAEDFDDAAARVTGSEPLHRILHDRHGADEKRIADVAREQIITTAFEIVAVGADSFEFRSGQFDPLGAAADVDHTQALAEAEHRRDEWRRIAELIPSTGIVAAPVPRLPEGDPTVTIDAEHWQILARLDGRRSVADVIGVLGQSAYEVCRVLFDLLETGMVEIVSSPQASDPPAS